jgi:PGF-CTERM protein
MRNTTNTTNTTRAVVVAAMLALAVCAGVALGSAAPTTTTDEQTNETAAVAVSDQQFDGESVTIDSATLPDGGFAVVYDEGNERIGHTEYLDEGDYDDLTVSLNESVEDSQVLVVTLYRNNGTETYNASEDAQAYQTETGADVSDVAYVYFEDQSRDPGDETTTGTSDESEDATETAADETTTEAATDGDESDGETEDASGDVPGFTPLTAVVALLGATLIVIRRR